MGKIYISYRRTDSSAITGRIYDYLRKNSHDDIIMDVGNIPAGVNFVEYIRRAVSECSVMLVIIGKNWLQSPDQPGVSRVADFIQFEIEAALRNQLWIIPILVDNSYMPPLQALPASIAELARRQALPIHPDPDFRRDMGRLLRGIEHGESARESAQEREGVFAQEPQAQIDSSTGKGLDSAIAPVVDTQKDELQPMSIFISYKAEDRPIISNLASALSEHGFPVWYDQRLMGGHQWWKDILANIIRADVFVFGLTPAALDSVPCQREYGYAHALHKRILPLLLVDGVDMRYLPPALQQIHGVRYRESETNALNALAESLEKLPPAMPLPNPLPDPPPVPVSPLGEIKEQLDAPELSLGQQALMLHQLRNLMKQSGSADDALRLLRQLADHPDARASITDEIRVILG